MRRLLTTAGMIFALWAPPGCANVFDADDLAFDGGGGETLNPEPPINPEPPPPNPGVAPPFNPEPPVNPEPTVNPDPPVNPDPDPGPIPDETGRPDTCSEEEIDPLVNCARTECEGTVDDVDDSDRIDDCFINVCSDDLIALSRDCQLCLLEFQREGFDEMLNTCTLIDP